MNNQIDTLCTESWSCFKAYDIRGRVGEELNEQKAYAIARAYAEVVKPKQVVVGADIRLSSKAMKAAVCRGLVDHGVDVIDLGMSGTEEVYFAVQHWQLDGGIEITASHNPADYNGMKLVGRDARPIGENNGLSDIHKVAVQGHFDNCLPQGEKLTKGCLSEYVSYLVSFINPDNIKPLTIVTNAGNGAAGHAIDAIESQLASLGVPITFIKIHHEADGHFPNGVPNPMLPENRAATTQAVIEHQADFGLAWDGDFDRCFFFDEKGQFIEGYYIVGLLAEAFALRQQGAKVIHDPRLYWNTTDILASSGGQPILAKAGHTYIKQMMREHDAVYGGEMSAHHYFRDFAYCDSGMIPWLLVAELLCVKSMSLSEAVEKRILAYPSSGEINSHIAEPHKVLSKVKAHYSRDAVSIDESDGISIEFEKWRFNLRPSNTEPLVRLNVESRGCQSLMEEKTTELLSFLDR
ncbi:phosphomannomutase/phosphoglucomutase [Photobacterium sanctipauli]|uniref:phosphomannomutase n=1 Tax=Photobacterium sanctipauli TaxID=1342794 RepID=A0A2T3NYC5_9GAMM|nr:phosphomannomutase/phosphoglucomutase [Photobacterium sanctipauli]PSW21208.1 phosphomannomutase/phosphoglucomutase [Photobacterium sanctipauli]